MKGRSTVLLSVDVTVLTHCYLRISVFVTKIKQRENSRSLKLMTVFFIFIAHVAVYHECCGREIHKTACVISGFLREVAENCDFFWVITQRVVEISYR
jgi:energy-coupling factor transporter transmembrane protein EcfT